MRSKRVLRYYCDHCKKSGCGKNAMLKHENRCVRNPTRICGFCLHMEQEQQPMTGLMQTLADNGLPALQELTNHCPACILAAIVQGRFNERPCGHDEDQDPKWIEFDFRAAVKQFWLDHENPPPGW